MLALDEGQRLAVAPDRTDDDTAQLAEREPDVRGDDELVLDHEHLDADKRPLRPGGVMRWVLSRTANPQPLQGIAPRRRLCPGPTASSTSTSVAPSSA